METAPSKLTCQRAAFDLPDDLCWLNCAYMSPLLHSVREAGCEGVMRRGRPWTISADDFFLSAEQLRGLFAGLIHADSDGVALVPSVSYGVGIATRNLPVQSGQSIVVVEEQFPSNIYPWLRLAEDTGARMRTVTRPDADWTDSIIDHIRDDTAVVAIPHVHWTTGTRFDLERIADRTRDAKSALLIDATQSLGTLPFDVNQIRPDFLVAAAYKGLLGPYGLTYMYVAPQWREGLPLEEGWLNRANSADFSQLTEYCDDYVAGARRYDFGERASSILLPMAIASLTQITEWTVPRIEQYTKPLIEYIISRADELGLSHPPLESCSPCMVGIGLPVESPLQLGKQLTDQQIHISVRKRNARIAPHLYNSRDDVDCLFDALAAALKS